MRTRIPLFALALLVPLVALLTGARATGPSVVVTITGLDGPHDMALNGDTNQIYSPNTGLVTMSVIDGSTNQLVDQMSFDLPIFAVAVNPATNRLYVSSTENGEYFITVVDLATNQTLTTLDADYWPIDMAVNSSTNRVYVVNHTDGTVTVIDGDTNKVTGTVEANFLARVAAVDETTNRIYVEGMSSLVVIDGGTNQVVDTIDLDKTPWGLDLNPATDRIYVANTFDSTVTVIDANSKQVVATVPVGTEPEALAVNPTTNHIIVPNGGSNDVTIIDGATNEVIATLPVGENPTGVAVNPVANLVYVANSADGTVSVIADPPTDETPTPTPPSGTTPFTLSAGWNQVCYVGAEQPIENALGPVLDDVSAVYRLSTGGGYDRWFPGRPEVSTIANVGPYKPLLLLMTEATAWNQTPTGMPPASVSLAQGWNMLCYAGAAKSPAEATSAIADDLSILYMLGAGQAWSRYVPGRPEVSNIAELGQYDAVLMLANGNGVTWTFSP